MTLPRSLFKGMAADVNGELVAITCVDEVPETYKVIYTKVSEHSGSHSTYEDKVSYCYESWDSSEKDKIPGLVPEIGKGDGSWSYWETKKVNAGDGYRYSLMDNIDSWACTETTHLATD